MAVDLGSIPDYRVLRESVAGPGSPHVSDRYWALKKQGRRTLFKTAPPVFDHTGACRIGGMWEPQRLWYEDASKVSIFVGGYGTGKTTIGVKKSIMLALANNGAEHWAVSPTEFDSDSVVQPMFEEYLTGRGIAWRWNSKKRLFTIQHGGRVGKIRCVSGHKPAKLKGQNLGSAWMDEPFIMSEMVFKNLLARLRKPGTMIKQLLMTGTPEQLGYGFELCEGDKAGELNPYVIVSTTMANKAQSADYVRDLIASYSEKEYRAYVLGEFVNLGSGIIYYAFDVKRNVVALGDPGDCELFVGMDFNVNPMTAVVGWIRMGHIHIFDEIRLPNSDTKAMCRELRQRYGERIRVVYPDPAGNQRQTNSGLITDHMIIEDHGFRVEAPGRWIPRRDTETSVNASFYPVDEPPRLSIHPSCRGLITDLQILTHENRNKLKNSTHSPDALKYLVWNIYPPCELSRAGKAMYA